MQPSLLRALGGVGSVAAALLLGGCGINNYLEERGKVDYKSASTVPRTSLEVPPDLVSPRGDERFAIPSARGGDRTRTRLGGKRRVTIFAVSNSGNA